MTIQDHFQRLVAAIGGGRYSFVDEKELQAGISSALRAAKFVFEREKVLNRADRPDFWLPIERIVIEVKIGGSSDAARRQITRYLGNEEVLALLVVTDRVQAGTQPMEINGKPVRVLALATGLR